MKPRTFATHSQRQKAALFILCCCLLALLMPLPENQVTSQGTSSPLLMNMRGDVWAWSGPGAKLQQRTNWGYNKNPILSPDGQRIAYRSTASFAVDAIKRSGGMGGGDLPANIWVLNVATNDAIRIAEQPPDASFADASKPEKYIIRSDPAWSPDSSAVAWSELVVNSATNADGTNQIVLYNLAQKRATVIHPDVPPQYGVPTALKIAWGNPGLAVWSIAAVNDPQSGLTSQESLRIYDTGGRLISAATLDRLGEFTWIKDRDKDYVGVLLLGSTEGGIDSQWVLIDPQTGRITGMPGVPELYSLNAPDGLTLVPVTLGTSPEWAIASPGNSQANLGNIDDVYVFSSLLAVSPDGQQVAYVKQGALYVYSSGKSTKINASDIEALAWGPTGWRVSHKLA